MAADIADMDAPRIVKRFPTPTPEQIEAVLRGEAVELIPAPGEGKRIHVLPGNRKYVIEDVSLPEPRGPYIVTEPGSGYSEESTVILPDVTTETEST